MHYFFFSIGHHILSDNWQYVYHKFEKLKFTYSRYRRQSLLQNRKSFCTKMSKQFHGLLSTRRVLVLPSHPMSQQHTTSLLSPVPKSQIPLPEQPEQVRTGKMITQDTAYLSAAYTL